MTTTKNFMVFVSPFGGEIEKIKFRILLKSETTPATVRALIAARFGSEYEHNHRIVSWGQIPMKVKTRGLEGVTDVTIADGVITDIVGRG